MKINWMLAAVVVALPLAMFATVYYHRASLAATASADPPPDTNPLCAPVDQLVDLLRSQFGESVAFVGHDPATNKWQLLVVNRNSSSWTWATVDQQGMACVAHMGTRASVAVPLVNSRRI